MLIRSKTFGLFVLALCVLAVMHIIATIFFLYWTYPWMDIPMHVLGGAVVAFFFLAMWDGYAKGSFKKGLAVTLGVVFAVGAVWELFEFMGGITMLTDAGYVGDTLKDFTMDLVGGFVGYLYVRAQSGAPSAA